jgi:hypothetical protein
MSISVLEAGPHVSPTSGGDGRRDPACRAMLPIAAPAGPMMRPPHASPTDECSSGPRERRASGTDGHTELEDGAMEEGGTGLGDGEVEEGWSPGEGSTPPPGAQLTGPPGPAASGSRAPRAPGGRGGRTRRCPLELHMSAAVAG